MPSTPKLLSELRRGHIATVVDVIHAAAGDAIGCRLRDLGFVTGEVIQVLSLGPLGGALLVQVGHTRFALRRAEAARVQVHVR